ncbi:MAG: hypothetical protein P1R58_01435 [bacterium]|nr:hypothetical protein [bacterium]
MDKGVPVERFLDRNGRFDLDAIRNSGYQGPLDLGDTEFITDSITGEPLVSGTRATASDPDDIYWDNAISPSLPGVDSRIYATAVFQGKLIAGGYFTTAGGVSASSIAAWDGSSWSSLGSGMNNGVYALSVYDNKLIAGGYFTTAGGKVSAYLAAWTKGAGCCLVPGDANQSGEEDISDLTYFVDFMFASGPPPICMEEFDIALNLPGSQYDCTLDISDLTWFVDYMFGGGPPPAACHDCP